MSHDRPRFEVFTTARSVYARSVAGELRRVPAAEAHAKTMGTTVTLCGEPTMNWIKIWDLAFVDVRTERCPACVAATGD